MNKWIRVSVSCLGLSVILLGYQNCSVRRLDGGFTSSIGSSTGADGTGGSQTSSACLIQPDTAGAATGIAQAAPIKSSFAMVQRQAAMGEFVPASTSLTMSVSSVCTSRADTTKVVRCDATPPPCSPSKFSSVYVTLKCDNASDKATACPNFDDKLNQELDIADATIGPWISISATNAQNICDTATVASYLPSLFGTPKVGKIKITKLETLANGKFATIKLIGVELLKDGTDAADKMTLDGTFSGEIISFAACEK